MTDPKTLRGDDFFDAPADEPIRSKEFLEKCDRRVEVFAKAFEEFRDRLYARVRAKQGGGHASGLHLNTAILRYAVERYFTDIDFERKRHRCGLLNGYRQAAYTLKWLIRLRPIQISLRHPDFLTANEDFALHAAITMLGVKPEALRSNWAYLAYALRHGTLDETLLMALAATLNPELAKGAK